LNTDPVTSEYMPSYRYVADDGRTRQSFPTKGQAETWLAHRS
jgi:hypothetical protein